jgi:hypothetical protein
MLGHCQSIGIDICDVDDILCIFRERKKEREREREKNMPKTDSNFAQFFLSFFHDLCHTIYASNLKVI